MAFDAQEFLSQWLSSTRTPSEPPRRSNRNKSGRTNRRQDQTARAFKAVGGKVSPVSAIYGGSDRSDPDNPRNVELCRVVDREIKAVTTFTNPDYQVPEGQWLGRPGCV